MNVLNFQTAGLADRLKDARARVVTMALLTMTGATQAAEFTDRVQSAKAIDTKAMRENVKSGADNAGFMIGVGAAVLGLVVMLWGLWWISSASRSEGRKAAGPGWVMVVVGGALGAGVPLFLWVVGAFNGAAG